ncbi:MAG TPA: cache domain-containing protein, partial [Thermoanaerobaculia bacterium]
METPRSLLRRLKLRTILVVALLLSGIIPLGVSSVRLIRLSNRTLMNSEQDNLTGEAGALSREVNTSLVDVRRRLEQLGDGILSAPGPADLPARLTQPWVGEQLPRFQRGNPDVISLRVFNLEGAGLEPGNLSDNVKKAMNDAFDQARSSKAPAYGFVPAGVVRKPQAILAVPISGGSAAPQLIVEAQLRFLPLEKVTRVEASKGVEVFLVDRQGKVLWSNDNGSHTAVLGKATLKSLSKNLTLTSRDRIPTAEGVREMFVQVSALPESNWSLVVQKPLSEVFADVDKLIENAAVST